MKVLSEAEVIDAAVTPDNDRMVTSSLSIERYHRLPSSFPSSIFFFFVFFFCPEGTSSLFSILFASAPGCSFAPQSRR